MKSSLRFGLSLSAPPQQQSVNREWPDMKSGRRIVKTTGLLVGMMVVLIFAGGCASAHKRAVMGSKKGSYGSIAFSPDSQHLAAAERFGSGVVIFEVATRTESMWFAPSKAANAGSPAAVSYTPEGCALAVFVGKDNLTVWSTATSNLLARIHADPPPDQVVLSPAGRYLAVSRRRGPVSIWEPGSGRKLLELTNGPANIVALAFAPDEQFLAIADAAKTIRFWNLSAGGLLTTLPPQRSCVNAMALANTNDLLAVSAGDVDVWRWSKSERVRTTPSASLGAGARTVGILVILATQGRLPSGSLEVFGAEPAGAVAFSPDGKYLAIVNSAANFDTALGKKLNQVRIIEVATSGELPAVADAGKVHSVAFSPDGHWLATAGLGVNVWDWINTKEPTPYAPVVVHLQANFTANPAAPVARLPAASVRVGAFVDARPQTSLGERTAAFKMKMSDVLPARPVAEAMREAVVGVFAGAAEPAGDGPRRWEITGTVRKFSVRTPATLMSWKIEVEVELELRVTNAQGRAVHSAVYQGQAHRTIYLWPGESLIEKACGDALRQVLQNIQSAPAWSQLSQTISGEPHAPPEPYAREIFAAAWRTPDEILTDNGLRSQGSAAMLAIWNAKPAK